MKALLKAVLMVLTVSTSQIATAHSFSTTNETLSGEFSIAPGQTQIVYLSGWRYVQKIYVQATSYNSESVAVDVSTNGTAKARIYLPSQDPSFVVPVNETVSSIEFRNTSGNWAKVYGVTGVMASSTVPVPPVYNPNPCQPASLCNPIPGATLPSGNLGSTLATRAIKLVDGLESFANYREYGVYLLPIKKVAAHTYATTVNFGDLSLVSRQALLALKQQIAFATPYLDETFERDAAFQLSVELTSLGQQLEALLR